MRRKLTVFRSAGDSFPQPQGRWAEALLGGPVPAEPLATCDACVMLGASSQPEMEHFNPATKCCTYMPRLPNFCVGAALADGDPRLSEGRDRVRAQVLARRGVSPLGLEPSRAAIELYGEERFGKSELLRCPFYVTETGGSCGIWRHRNAVCSTWFCKHTRGGLSYRFWRALERALTAAERALERFCALELDVGARALEELGAPRGGRPPRESANAEEDSVDERAYRARWGRWLGRELEFFEAAAQLVQPLSWADVERLGGTEIAVRKAVALHAYGALRAEHIPTRARAAPFHLAALGATCSRVVSYSPFDPIDVPTELLPLLAHFDGSSVDQARQVIEQRSGIRLDDTLVQKLLDFGMLVDSDA